MRGAAAAFVLLGCGGSSLSPVALEDFGPAAQDALCEWAVRCRHVPDDATCRRLLDPKSYDTRRAEDAVAAGRLAYDPDAAARCLEATAGAACLADPFSDPSCGDMFEGLVAQGGACTSSFECAGSAACEMPVCDVQCCVGQCGAPGLPPPDPPPPAKIGEACVTHDDCVPEAYCETDRVCARLPDEEGERCLFGCAWGDLYCDLDALVCRRYAELGEACDAGQPCDPAYAFCDGVCQPRPGPGEPCDDVERVCVAWTNCLGTPPVCVARGDAGASCTADGECRDACDEAAGVCVGYEACQVP